MKLSAIAIVAALAALAQAQGGRSGPPRIGLNNKLPDYPAGLFTAGSTVARSALRHEWVDIPAGSVKLRTWIEYPQGQEKAPVVVVMQHDEGLDEFMRAIADQLASQGFIAVDPDIFSGLGSFRYPDVAMKAAARLSATEIQRRYKAAWDYARKLPRANGKSASLGLAAGGASSFRFAGEVPELDAAVVFYGMPPSEALMAKIKAPVLGLYGEDDDAVVRTIEPTAAAMKRLGKSYESHVYPHATHAFMTYQVEGENGAAIVEAWPRAIAFLKEHTRSQP